MQIVAKVKLRASPAQSQSLVDTLRRCNQAATWLALQTAALGVRRQFDIQKLFYQELRGRFGLTAQLAIRVIAKVADAFKNADVPVFRELGSVECDKQVYSIRSGNIVSIQTLGGRIQLPYVAGGPHFDRLNAERGAAKLVLRKGRWYLHIACEVDECTPIQPTGALGVDLGIVNIATDSDGDRYTGAGVESVRVRILNLRSDLQSCGSKRAKRTLKRLAGRESRFRSNTNHTLSKRLVVKAKDTGRTIVLEDLKGIRDRVTVRKSQRARHSGWSFFQLREFVAYKAKIAGVPVILVDPRNTSRTCTECGYCDKANRRSQSEFVCKSCGFADHADVVGARNVARKAAVHQPIVGVVDAGNTETVHRVPPRRRPASPSLARFGQRGVV